MFMSILWDTIFQLNDSYENAQVFLIDRSIPALRLGTADKPTVFAAGFGGEQWQSSALLLRFFERLLFAMHSGNSMAGIAVKKAFKKRSLVLIPTVCPAKMKDDVQPMKAADLRAMAQYLSFSRAQMLVALEGHEGCLISPKTNAQLSAGTQTIEKILSACSGLPLQPNASGAAAGLCRWASENNRLPSFVLSPPALEASKLDETYRFLEETLLVSALL